MGDHVVHGVLPGLRGVADCVHDHKVLVELRRAVLLQHGFLEQLADGLRFSLEHGGLVGNAHLVEHGGGVEPVADGVLELFQKFLVVAAAQDQLRHVLGLRHVLHDHVIPRERSRRNRLLVGPLLLSHIFWFFRMVKARRVR